jgi:hypothetical protein
MNHFLFISSVQFVLRHTSYNLIHSYLKVTSSVVDPGSGAFLPHGSEIIFFLDPGSQIPEPYNQCWGSGPFSQIWKF